MGSHSQMPDNYCTLSAQKQVTSNNCRQFIVSASCRNIVAVDRAMAFDYIKSSRGFEPGRGRVLPYMGSIGMCRCEWYGFQAVYSSIGYINQSVWV